MEDLPMELLVMVRWRRNVRRSSRYADGLRMLSQWSQDSTLEGLKRSS